MALEDMAATPPLDEGGDVNAEVAALVEKYGQEAVQGAVDATGGPPGGADLGAEDAMGEAGALAATLDEDVGAADAPDMGAPPEFIGDDDFTKGVASRAMKGKGKGKDEDEAPIA
jgi:hypothetical protein